MWNDFNREGSPFGQDRKGARWLTDLRTGSNDRGAVV